MALTAKDSGGSSYPPVPEGLHLATCYGVWDLGTQHDDKWNKDIHKAVIVWELPEERIDIDRDGESVNLPRAISKMMTLSLHEKAAMRKLLQSWRGRAFTPEELEGFDLKTILGVSCQVQVIHVTKDNKTYSNIETVVPAKGITRETENAMKFFSFEEGRQIPQGTPSWIEDIIHTSLEWNYQPVREEGSFNEPPVGTEPPPNDDIPF